MIVSASAAAIPSGEYVKDTPKSSIIANIDFDGKTIPGQSGAYYDENQMEVMVNNDDPSSVMCYGTIEIANERGVEGYDIVFLEGIDSPEPNIWVVSWEMPDLGSVRVGVDYDSSKKTITLNDWEGGDYFNDVTLKRK